MIFDRWWEKILVFLLDWWSGRQRHLGRTEMSEKQKAEADKLREDYDEINNDGRDLGSAIGSLRSRSRASRDRKSGSLPKPK